MHIRTLLYACSPLLLALALSSCGGGNPTPPPAEKPTLGQPVLENPDVEGEDLTVNIPVTGSQTLTLSTTLDGAAASVRSSASFSSQSFSAQAKNYVGHITLIKQRTTPGDDWSSSPSDSGDMDFTTAGPGGGPRVLHLGFEDYWGSDEVDPLATSRDFTLRVSSPGLTPVFIPIKPKRFRWDASIKKTVTINPVAGGSGEFALNIAHLGPSSSPILPGQLKVLDPVVAPLTLNGPGSVAANATFWTCLSVGNLLGCKNTNTITTSTIIPPIRVLVNAPVGSETKAYVNCGYIRSYDRDLTNNRSCLEGQIGKPTEGKLDFAIKKELVKPLILGGQGAYTLTVANVGTVAAPAPAVVVNDPMPVGLTLNPSPPTIPNWDCSASTPTNLSCKYIGPTPAQIVPSASSTLTFSVDVSRDIQGEVKNCARVLVEGDVNPQDNSTCITNPTGTPTDPVKFDVVVKKTTEIPLNSSGQALFLLQPSNAGPGVIPASAAVSVTDPMPLGLSLNVALAISSNALNWNCSASTSSTLNCVYVGSYPIAVGPFAAVQVPVQLNPLVALGKENCARILATGESDPENNFSCTPIVPFETPRPYHVKLEKKLETETGISATGAPTAGMFILTPTNAGPGSIPSGTIITVSDPMPTGLSLIVPSAAGNVVTLNPLWNCSTSTSSNLSCTYIGSFPVPVGAFANIKVPVNRVPGVSLAGENCATISASGDSSPTSEPKACAPTQNTTPKPDVSVVKTQEGSISPSAAAPGQGLFLLTVSNPGSTLNSGPVTVTDILPAGLALNVALANSMNLPTWNCAASNSSTLSCTLATFPFISGANSTIKVPVVTNSQTHAQQNCASIALSGDLNPNNDRSCVDVIYK